MPTSYTSLLGFALPVTGELQGTWGTTVNDSITELVEDAIAATATFSVTSGNWTLSTTGSGAANEARCAILIPTGTPGVSRNIIAPSQSKAYIVINQSNAAVVLKGAATTGVTIATGTEAVCAWNGSDFVVVATADIGNLSGTLLVANGGTGQSSLTLNNVILGNGTSAVQFVAPGTNGNVLTSNGTTWVSAAVPAGDVTLAGNNAFTGANTFFNGTGQTIGTGTSTQDGLILAGRAGGSSSYRITLQPTTLTASRTLTLPNVTDTVATIGSPQTFTALQTFSGASSTLSSKFLNALEAITVSATVATGTINYDVTTQSIIYYTSNASANWTVNFRASSGTSLNSAMSTGESITVAFLVTQGSTPYYNNVVQVDGSTVTPKWQGGTAPTSGNASSIDAYVYSIVKTGSAAFTVFASQTKFA